MLLLVLVAVVWAIPGLRVSSDLREHYLQGHAVEVTLTLENTGTAPVQVADLAERPWLVRFALTDARGTRQARSSAPPPTDPGGVWTLPPRGRRQVTLEVPTSGALAAGSYTLKVEIPEVLDEPLVQRIELAPPRLVHAQLQAHEPPADASITDLWVHSTGKQQQAYLRRGPRNEPAITSELLLLATGSGFDSAALSRAAPGRPYLRHLYWPVDAGVEIVASTGRGLVDDPRRVAFPWPETEVLGIGATDARGALVLPLWVPSPAGAGGEMKVAVVAPDNLPVYRRASALKARPISASTVLDADGAAHILVQESARLLVYSTRGAGDVDPDVPLRSRRMGVSTTPIVGAGFVATNDLEGGAGGLGIWLLAGNRLQWLSMAGQVRGERTLAQAASAPLAVSPSPTLPGFATGPSEQASFVSTDGKVPVALPATGWWAISLLGQEPVLRVLTPSAKTTTQPLPQLPVSPSNEAQ